MRDECATATATNADRTWVRISDTPREAAERGWVAAEFLKFGDDATAIERLPIVAVPPPPPTPPPNVELSKPVGIEHLGDAKYVCYGIEGSNGNQLATQMNENGPFSDISPTGRARAVASTAIRYRGPNYAILNIIALQDCNSNGTSPLWLGRLADTISVTIDATITMPCWYPPPGTSHEEVTKFDGFMQSLARHELKHVEIAQQYARMRERQLKNPDSCDEATLRTIYDPDQSLRGLDAAQDAFHASPEGQGIPYP
jgi:hypothetical protein